MQVSGRCLCQQVSYHTEHTPKEVGCCYCKACQIKSGSDHTVYLAFAIDEVSITGSVKWYDAVGESGLAKQHGFCANCGSVLFGKAAYWPTLIVVYAGSLDDASIFTPQTNIWLQDAPAWACINKELPGLDKNPGSV